jgi:hypothetical protein
VKRRLMDLRTWSQLLSVAGVAAGLVLTPAVASAAPSDLNWALDRCVLANPAYGPPTTQVKVHGCGFWSHERVEVFFGSALVARAVTDNLGRFQTQFNVPPTTAGTPAVTAVGLSSNRYFAMNFVVVSEVWHKQPGSE